MFQKKQRYISLYLIVFAHSLVFVETRTNTIEPTPTLHESSRDLGKAFVVFFNTLSKEIADQAQVWGTKLSDYVDSMKSQNSKLFSIEQQTVENKFIITIKGFEHIDASTCCDAKVSYNYQNVADKVVISVGPDTKVTISAFESPLVNNMITVSVEAMVEKKEEVKQDDANEAVLFKISKSKAQKTVSFTTERSVNLDAISIEFDAQTKTLQCVMPFIEEQTKSVRVRVR